MYTLVWRNLKRQICYVNIQVKPKTLELPDTVANRTNLFVLQECVVFISNGKYSTQ